jgi:glycerophosphoryl diester phosphodiesterase
MNKRTRVFLFLVLLLVFIAILCIISVIESSKATGAVSVIGHRGARTKTVPEDTLAAYKYAEPYVDTYETDVRWTRDPAGTPDRTMILLHDETVDRTTNCTGRIQDLYWSYVQSACYTDIGHQRITTLQALIDYSVLTKKKLVLEIKAQDITDWQARQFWNMVKPLGIKVQVTAFSGGALRSLLKVKKFDTADTIYQLQYGLEASSPPTVAYVKAVGYNLHIDFTSVTAAQVKTYREWGLRVYLWTGQNESDYKSMLAKKPTGVIVDDAKRYQAWIGTQVIISVPLVPQQGGPFARRYSV